jgi:hypothetical protein
MKKEFDKLQAPLKFRLQEKLDSLSYADRKVALEAIPSILGITRQTFFRWRTARKNGGIDIPVSKLIVISRILNCSIEELIADEISAPSLEQCKKWIKPTCARSMKLVK